VPPMQLVELIPGIATDDETFEAVRELILLANHLRRIV
jgi:3-hydroxyacyl-CoA dehydrogenase